MGKCTHNLKIFFLQILSPHLMLIKTQILVNRIFVQKHNHEDKEHKEFSIAPSLVVMLCYGWKETNSFSGVVVDL